MVQIDASNASDEGIYSVSVSSTLNTIPIIGSTDPYVFVISLADNSCSRIEYTPQPLVMQFHISDGAAPVTSSFNDFTYFLPGSTATEPPPSCGFSQYELVQGYSGLTFSAASKTFTFATTDPFATGTHDVVLMVDLVDYPQFSPVIYYLEIVSLQVTAACWDTDMQYVVPAEM